jgi:hypothetical protein
MGRPRAWNCRRIRPVTVKITQAPAKMSMNQLQALPVLRPLCRSLSRLIPPRLVFSC